MEWAANTPYNMNESQNNDAEWKADKNPIHTMNPFVKF